MSAYHLIGCGGAGMSVVAELLLARGHEVTGSDQRPSATLERLSRAGVTVWSGHDPQRVPPHATVVVSTAIRPTDPELAWARERGQEIIHRSQALALAARGLDFVAIAGTHGKTTTAGMAAAALNAAGEDPSFAVGSLVKGFESGAHIGKGKLFIAEADESDGSFLNYEPRIAVVTNIEPDHLDHYGSAEAVDEAFVDFASLLGDGGTLIACADDEGSARLARRARAEGIETVTYGHGVEADARICSEVLAGDSSSIDIVYRSHSTQLVVPVPGAHNILNATAAWLVGVTAGVERSTMARALAAFRGTGRRFDTRGVVGGVRVVDDYAHHPTEVAALIEQARQVASGQVRVVFQPHLFSRTKAFAAEFARALAGADEAIVTDVFAAREDPDPQVTSRLITDAMEKGAYVADMNEAGRLLASHALKGDVLVTVGAGSITTVADVIVAELERMYG